MSLQVKIEDAKRLFEKIYLQAKKSVGKYSLHSCDKIRPTLPYEISASERVWCQRKYYAYHVIKKVENE
jgi:hypothetical protein